MVTLRPSPKKVSFASPIESSSPAPRSPSSSLSPKKPRASSPVKQERPIRSSRLRPTHRTSSRQQHREARTAPLVDEELPIRSQPLEGGTVAANHEQLYEPQHTLALRPKNRTPLPNAALIRIVTAVLNDAFTRTHEDYMSAVASIAPLSKAAMIHCRSIVETHHKLQEGRVLITLPESHMNGDKDCPQASEGEGCAKCRPYQHNEKTGEALMMMKEAIWECLVALNIVTGHWQFSKFSGPYDGDHLLVKLLQGARTGAGTDVEELKRAKTLT